MKVAQNDETNPDTQPVHPPRVPSIENLQHFTSGSSVRKRETPGILSWMFPPFVGITYYRDWAHLASILVMSCIVMHLFALYSLFLPPLLSGRLRDRRRCWCPDRLRCWRPLLLARAIRQAPPWSPDIAYSFSLLLALEYCSMLLLSVNPILLHSLSLLLQLLIPLPAILHA